MNNLKKYLAAGIGYKQYFDNETQILASDKAFEYKHYHELNYQRLKRNAKVAEQNITLSNATKQQFKGKQLLVISEGWCGDAAQILPFVNEVAVQADITLKIVYRDENLPLIDAFLTKGGRSIPVIILTQQNGDYINHFAPRPAEAQQIMLDLKALNRPKEEISLALQKWYNKDKGGEIFKNIIALAQ